MLVSVIIPCYNCEEFVGRAIESVLHQRYTNWELLLINNNSGDNTQLILDYYCSKYPGQIKCFFENKPGAPAARNCGLRLAKGTWIQFLDADDELWPGKIENQVNQAILNNAQIVAGAYYLKKIDHNSETNELHMPWEHNIWKSLIASKLGITSANLWDRNAVINAGGWDEERSSSQEYELLFRMIVSGANIYFDMIPQTYVYSQASSISNTKDKHRLEQIMTDRITLRTHIKNFLQTNGLFTKELSDFWDLYIYRLLIKRRVYIPKYVDHQLKELKLKVPIGTRIKLNTKSVMSSIFSKKLLSV